MVLPLCRLTSETVKGREQLAFVNCGLNRAECDAAPVFCQQVKVIFQSLGGSGEFLAHLPSSGKMC